MLAPRILLVTVMLLTVTSSNGDIGTGGFDVYFNSKALDGNVARLLEGDNLTLECSQYNSTYAIEWDVLLKDYPVAMQNIYDEGGLLDNPFTVKEVTRYYSGKHRCMPREGGWSRIIQVDVLYPPSYPKITSGKENSPNVHLNCSTDSNPPATYIWKDATLHDHDATAEPLGYGPLITIHDVTEETTVYCIVKNIMEPTHGKVVETIIVAKHVIKLQTIKEAIKENVDITNNGDLVAAAVTGWVLVVLFLIGLGILVVWIKWGGTGGNRRPTGGRKNIPNKQRSVMFTSDEYSSAQRGKSKTKLNAIDMGKDSDEIKPIAPERPSHTLPTDKQPLPANMEVESQEMNEGTATDTDDHYEDLDHTATEAFEERYDDIEESEMQKEKETLSPDGYEKPIESPKKMESAVEMKL